MPQYFFDIKNGDRVLDPSGSSCIDDAAAFRKAGLFAVRVGIDIPSQDTGRYVAVLNCDGDELLRVPVACTEPDVAVA